MEAHREVLGLAALPPPSALEQWALSDPLAEALDLADADQEPAEDDAEPSESELEEFLFYPNPGESL